jgi:hypothetical protein
MYVPRIEQVFPWIGIGVILVGVIVIGIISLWLGKRLEDPNVKLPIGFMS